MSLVVEPACTPRCKVRFLDTFTFLWWLRSNGRTSDCDSERLVRIAGSNPVNHPIHVVCMLSGKAGGLDRDERSKTAGKNSQLETG